MVLSRAFLGVSTLASLALAVLVLHNGQGAVERGFSNKNVIETNMRELTLVSKRLIQDHLYANALSSLC